ncbi:MAG: hypothetical protein JWR13_3 [Mycobacterium sp.]|nr:hypothetical protein [Mycobacterium sp.]
MRPIVISDEYAKSCRRQRHRADDADLPDHRDSVAERFEFLEERPREPGQLTVSGQVGEKRQMAQRRPHVGPVASGQPVRQDRLRGRRDLRAVRHGQQRGLDQVHHVLPAGFRRRRHHAPLRIDRTARLPQQ